MLQIYHLMKGVWNRLKGTHLHYIFTKGIQVDLITIVEMVNLQKEALAFSPMG